MRQRLNPWLVFTLFAVVFASLMFSPKAMEKEVQSRQEAKQVKKQVSKQVKTRQDLVEAYLDEMTIDQKIGQLFYARVPETNQVEDLQNYHLGGYVLFSRDFEGQNLDSLTQTLASYQANSSIPLLIASDEEGGTVTRISQLLDSPFESPLTLYKKGGVSAVIEDSRQKASFLKNIGIQSGLFPVADLAQKPSSFIYDRTIGQDAQTTADYIRQLVTALSEEQFASTLKHFPGYGDNLDSHTDIVTDKRSLDSLRKSDFLPFQAGIDAGADSIMVSHNILAELDSVPSSISPKVTQLIRQELGFDGVIITDDMDMAGLADFVSQEEAAYRAIEAGNDMIMSSQYPKQIAYLKEKVTSGELTEDRLDQSVRRILKMKAKLGLLPELAE